MNKVLPLIAFSVLLLVPAGFQNALAEIVPGVGPITLGNGPGTSEQWSFTALKPNVVGLKFEIVTSVDHFCSDNIVCVLTLFDNQGSTLFTQTVEMSSPATTGHTDFIILDSKIPLIVGDSYLWRLTSINGQTPKWNLTEMYYDNDMCGEGTILSGVLCIAQTMGSMIGGTLVEINTVSLLVVAIGVNPIITGLVGITIAGVAGQAIWFVHRRRKSENS